MSTCSTPTPDDVWQQRAVHHQDKMLPWWDLSVHNKIYSFSQHKWFSDTNAQPNTKDKALNPKLNREQPDWANLNFSWMILHPLCIFLCMNWSWNKYISNKEWPMKNVFVTISHLVQKFLNVLKITKNKTNKPMYCADRLISLIMNRNLT